jgi:hypothetical protein
VRRIILLLAFCALAAFPQTPETVDHGQEKTHKTKHEKTPYYTKSKVLCGYLFESRDGTWANYLVDPISVHISQRFETRAEAAAWMKGYCPIQGSVVLQ